MRTVQDIPNLKNKKVLLRVDFDVPLEQLTINPESSPEASYGAGSQQLTKIRGDFRIKRQKKMIDWLVERGAKVIMIAHLHSEESSFFDLMPQLHILLGYKIRFIKKIEDIEGHLANYQGIGLLDNIRKFDGEKENSKELAGKLSKGFDVYINNDFAVCHRNHASVSAITEFLPSYAGLLVKEEVTGLQKAIDSSKVGKVVIIGGAKAETKVPVIKNFIDKADLILLGGVVANDVLKEKGRDMDDSIVDENSEELLAGLDINDPKLLVPDDFVVFDNRILDIGEKTIRKYADAVRRASMVIWNGPMGLFENPSFAMGTNELAKAIVASNAYKIVGGGDTISALDKLGIIGKFDFVSTGGGAMLAFLAGQHMPGLESLGYYKNQNAK